MALGFDKIKQYRMSSKQSAPFFYFITVVFVFIFGAKLFTKGLFVDGIFYGAVAQSLADGYGDFWHLSSTKHFAEGFYGHPPFAIWLLSYCMQLFDAAFWVERLFSIFNLLLLLWGMAKIWQLTSPKSSILSVWWVWLLWLCIPINIWSFQQYMLENTMVVFVVWSVYWGLKAVMAKTSIRYTLIAGGFLFLASFSKGPVGLFPLASMSIYWFIFRNISLQKAIRLSLISLLCIVIPYVILFATNTDVVVYFYEYFRRQINRSLSGVHFETKDHFFILKTLLIAPLVLWILLILTKLGARYKWKSLGATQREKKWFWFFLLVTLSGTLPIMISPKQMGFYIVPAMPFLALAIAHISFPLLTPLLTKLYKNKNWQQPFFFFNSLALMAGIAFTINQYGNYSRDQTIIEDVTTLSKTIPPYSKILLKTKEHAYGVECYFIRIGKISAHSYRWQTSKKAEKKTPTPYMVLEKDFKKKLYFYVKDTSVHTTEWDLYLLNDYFRKERPELYPNK